MTDTVVPAPVPPSAPDAEDASVDKRVAKGALWMILARLSDRGLGVISTILLARLLVPEDFGLVAMASSIIAMLELFSTFSFDVALIQSRDTDRDQYDTAWSFNVIAGLAKSLLLVALAIPAAQFYDDPRLRAVMLCLAFGTAVEGFENIGTVVFRKELRFHKEFQFLFARRLAGFLVTVPLAFALRSYWALVIGTLAGRCASLLLSYLIQSYRPRFSLRSRDRLFRFSSWLMLSNLTLFLNNRSVDFIIGKLSGAGPLGLFNLSRELANLPTSELVAPINRATYSGYAKKAANRDLLRKGFLDVTAFIATAAIPAGVGIAAVSDLAVPVVFGPRWLAAIPALAALALAGILLALRSNSHYIYLALGKPHIATTLGFIQNLILIPLLAFAVLRAGAQGASLAFLISEALFTPVSYAFIIRLLSMRWMDLLVPVTRPTIAAAAMFLVVRSFVRAFDATPEAGSAALAPLLVGSVLLGALVYTGVLYSLWRLARRPEGPEHHLLVLLRRKIGG